MSAENAPTIVVTAYGETNTLAPEVGYYDNGGRIALGFRVDSTGEPFATATVNIPNKYLKGGELFIKDWSENINLIVALVAAGWLIPTGREVPSGHVTAKVMRPAGPLAEFIRTTEGTES